MELISTHSPFFFFLFFFGGDNLDVITSFPPKCVRQSAGLDGYKHSAQEMVRCAVHGLSIRASGQVDLSLRSVALRTSAAELARCAS